MAEVLKAQMDYIYFLYGTGFFLLAAVCFSLRGVRKFAMPWAWLGFFGVLHGANEWLDMIALMVPDPPAFKLVRLCIMALSFVALVEFGRAGTKAVTGNGPDRWVLLLLVVPCFPAALTGLPGANCAARYALGLVGGLWSAAALCLAAGTTESGSARLRLRSAAAVMAVYALASGLVVPSVNYFPASVVNYDWFIRVFHIPVQLLRAALAISVSALVSSALTASSRAVDRSNVLRYGCHTLAFSIAVVAVIAGGWALTDHLGKMAEAVSREVLLSDCRLMAAVIDAKNLRGLGEGHDMQSIYYPRLREQMRKAREARPEFRYVYLTMIKNGKIIFSVDSEQESSPVYTPPGDAYTDAPDVLHQVFAQSLPEATAEYSDQWGDWVSGFCPIRDGGGNILAVMGLDRGLKEHRQSVSAARLRGIVISGMILALLLAFFVTYRRQQSAFESVAQAEKEARESEGKLRGISSAALDAILVADSNGRLTFWNRSAASMFGFAGNELGLADMHDLLVPEDGSGLPSGTAEQEQADAWRSAPGTVVLATMVRKDGSKFPAELSVSSVKLQGEWVTVYVARDVTSRKRAEDALRESERKYRSILENIQDMYYRTDKDGLVVFASPSAARVLGYDSVGDLLGQHIRNFWEHPDDRIKLLENLDSRGRVDDYRIRMVKKDGSSLQASISTHYYYGDNDEWLGVEGIVRDITERERMESEILEERERLAVTLRSIGDGVIAVDLDLNIILMNDVAAQLTGWNIDEAVGHPFDDVFRLVNETTGETADNPVHLAMESKQTVELEDNIALVSRDGKERSISDSCSPILDANGEMTGVVIVFRDSTEKKRAENAVRESENRLRTVMHSVQAGIVLIDAETHKIVEVNSGAARMIGRAPEEIVGSMCHNFVCPAQEGRCPVTDLHQTVDNAERELLQANGERRPVIKTAVPIELGGKPYLLESFVDITDLKQAEGTLKRRDVLLASAAQGAHALLSERDLDAAIVKVLIALGQATEVDSIAVHKVFVDPSTGKEMANIRYEWNHGNDTLLPIDTMRHPVPVHPTFTKWHEILMRNETVVANISDAPDRIKDVMRGRGSKSVILAPIFASGKMWGFIGFDEGKGLREWDRSEVAILQTMASSLGSAFERSESETALLAAKNAAEIASHAKGDFLANMSHEIRTPLNGVVGMSELLLGTNLDARQRKYARTITYSAEVLLELISDILDFSKIESGKIELEESPFQIREMIEGLIETVRPHAARKGLELLVDVHHRVPDFAVGDQARIRQVLLNLVNNAIKFTASGEVAVSCSVVGRPNSRMKLSFSVRDTGIGVPEDRLDRLFQVFSQVDASTTRKYGGTGLGLAICKRLVEAMGGKIDVDSVDGQGSVFWFDIELQTPRVGTRQTKSKAGVGLARRRVLVVDDNATNREILQAQLAKWKMQVVALADPQQVIPALSEAISAGKPFDVAIVDGQMPVLDGVTLSLKIREVAELTDLPIVLLSSMDDIVVPDSLTERGPMLLLTKPAPQSALIEALTSVTCPQPEIIDQPDETPALTETTAGHYDASAVVAVATRILLAEDNEINQLVVTEILNEVGIPCDVVASGDAAVEAATRGNYDLILMDCQMPVMDGYQATAVIRAQETERHTPIIALTAHAMAADKQKCFDAGMDDYLSKPVMPNKLLGVLQKWLSSDGVGDDGQVPEEDQNDPEDALPIDYEALLNRCMGNAKLVEDVVSKFLQRTPDELRQIKEGLEAGDFTNVVSLAHRTKGAAATLSAEPMRAQAEALETAARESDSQPALEALKLLEEALARMTEYANRHIRRAA